MLELDLHILRCALPVMVDAKIQHHFFTCAGGITKIRVAALDRIGLPADLHLWFSSSGALLFIVFRTLGHHSSPVVVRSHLLNFSRLMRRLSGDTPTLWYRCDVAGRN